MYKHSHIEKIIMDMINDGVLKEGEPVPSIRRMAHIHDMSITPVIEAYHNLEQNEIITARNKSRYVVAPIKNKKSHRSGEPAPDDWDSQITELRESVLLWMQGNTKYPFGRPAIHVDQKNNAKVAAHFSSFSKKFLSLDPPPIVSRESSELITELCRQMYRVDCHVSNDDIILCEQSLFSAISVALAVTTSPGDSVGIAEPASVTHHMALTTRHLNPVLIDSVPGKGILLDSLIEAHRHHPEMKVILVSANFDTPTGTLMSEEDKIAISRYCEENGITVIEDDNFGALNYEKYRPYPLFRYAPNNTIYVSSINIMDLQALSLCYIVTKNRPTLFRYYRDTISGVPSPMVQYCYANIMRGITIEKRRDFVRQMHRSNTKAVASAVEKHFPKGTKIHDPSGGYGLWIELPENINMTQIQNEAINRSVSFFPGNVFSSAGNYANYMYLNCSVIDGEPQLLEGIEILGEIVKNSMNSSN